MVEVPNAGAAEEVVIIETDKIEVSVSAPAAGRITELLANEKDTVTACQESPRRGAFHIKANLSITTFF